MAKIDQSFFDRADAHIELSNSQIKDATPGKVTASMMYGAARYISWFSTGRFKNAAEMKKGKTETIDHFTSEFRKMLEDNYDDYAANFERYLKTDT